MKERVYYHKKLLIQIKRFSGANLALRNTVTTKLRKEESNYHSTQFSGKHDCKQIWKTLNDILPKKSESMSTGKFNKLFTQIAGTLVYEHLRNASLPSISTPELHRILFYRM